SPGVVLGRFALPAVRDHGLDHVVIIGRHDLEVARRVAVVLEAAEQLLDDGLEAAPRPLALVLRQERDRHARAHQSPSVSSTSLTWWMPVWWAMKKRSASFSVKLRHTICSRPSGPGSSLHRTKVLRTPSADSIGMWSRR